VSHGPDTAVILCGGRGTRLQEKTHAIPKALVEIGGRPIIWHVVQLYAVQGVRRVVLCTGYLGDQIAEYVASRPWAAHDIEVEAIETGLDTMTGGRIKRIESTIDGAPFYATYGDGLADVDLGLLTTHHRDAGTLATMTVVRPELQFGITEIGDGSLVSGFHEKPRSDHWINGGFFHFEPGVFAYLRDDSTVLEREPLEGLAADGQLSAYRHLGFWECMDTYKDAVQLNDLWEAGNPPWQVREQAGDSR
jgi:glucose-1-phosphate cytidylyltransferase